MDFYKLIEYRASVRKFKPDPIDSKVLERVLDAARLAPSAANRQPWKFILVRDKETRERLAELCWRQQFIAEAPVVIVACALESEGSIGGTLPSSILDTAIAVTHLMLAAAVEKLGTCWIGAFESGPVRELLEIPDNIAIAAVMPLGYPAADNTQAKSRKPLDQIVCKEKFSE